MSTELKQAAQLAVDTFDVFGEDDDFESLFALTQKMNALRAAIQQAEAQQPATPEPVARVELMQTGGNAGLATRIVEIDDPLRERLRPGDVLYTHPSPGEPVGQAPSVWNSIQIASWIGSQLMHEPSMFERNAVCKFVRSLGRHPTLLKHSPKDTCPAPGVPEGYILVKFDDMVRLASLIGPAPLEQNGKTYTFNVPNPDENLRLISATVRAMLAASPTTPQPKDTP